MSDSWLDHLSDILSKPLPGTETKKETSEQAPDKPVIFGDDDDDESILDKITDILTQPLPGTTPSTEAEKPAAPAKPENPGEVAVNKAQKEGQDPVSTTGAAGADWMQAEYERFLAYQENTRKSFAEQQRLEQERFAAYQRSQLDRLMRSQERERLVFQQHQQARLQAWRGELNRTYAGGPPGAPPPGFPPGMMPPPPPPWWRRG